MASKTEEWLAKPLPLGAKARCSDCAWTQAGPWSHRDGHAHTTDLGHLVHVDDGMPPVENPVENR